MKKAQEFKDAAANAPIKAHEARPFYTTREEDLGRAMLVGMAIGGIIFSMLTATVVYSIATHFDRCDVNRDGKVTAFDVLLVQRHVLGLEDTP